MANSFLYIDTFALFSDKLNEKFGTIHIYV